MLAQCLPLVVGAGVPGDGMFRVHPGDVIAAVYEDPDNPSMPSDPSQIDAAADTALISGGTSTGQFLYTIDPDLPFEPRMTPGAAPGESPRPLAMVLAPGNVPQVFGQDQADPALRTARRSPRTSSPSARACSSSR